MDYLLNNVYSDGTATINGHRVTHEQYHEHAMWLAKLYATTMSRHASIVKTTGWLRSGATMTPQIDIVAVPYETVDMFGETQRLALTFIEMAKAEFPATYYGKFNRSVRGTRTRTGFVQDGFEIFFWLSKSYRFGFDVILRTGPETFANWLLNVAVGRGRKHGLSIHDNALFKTIVTPEGVSQGKKPVVAETEEKVFEIAGIGYVQPQGRSAPIDTFTKLRSTTVPEVYTGTMTDREEKRDHAKRRAGKGVM